MRLDKLNIDQWADIVGTIERRLGVHPYGSDLDHQLLADTFLNALHYLNITPYDFDWEDSRMD